MKDLNWIMKAVFRSFFVCIAFPGLLFSAVQKLPMAEQNAAMPPSDTPKVVENVVISVKENNGKISKMDLEEYVLGVVLGEMPASFETEALKAQAVAARTYA